MNIAKLLSQVLAALCLGLFAFSVSAGKMSCENERYAAKHPEECGIGNVTVKTLEVTIYYGDEYTADPTNCLAPSCVSTKFTVEGTVTCSSQVCDFERTNESVPSWTSGEPLLIPPSQFNLLAKTSIRGTDIVPAYCFETGDYPELAPPWFNPKNPPDGVDEYSEPGSTRANVNGFWLRSPVVSTADAEGMWWAHVWAMSKDMKGADRQYRFNFGGPCKYTDSGGYRCPTLRENSDDDPDFGGHFEDGFAGSVFGENTNPRGDGQTCRCTVSSKPGCPEHVVMDGPRPASWIYIKEL